MIQDSISVRKYAEGVLKNHRGNWILVKVFFPPVGRALFSTMYAYFRWLDDQIDEGTLDAAQQNNLLQRAHRLLLYGDIENPSALEQGVIWARDLAAKLQLEALEPAKQMLNALELDSKRRGSIPSSEDLIELRRLRVVSTMNAVSLCMHGKRLPRKLIPDYGVACDEVHILRDLNIDVHMGIFNFSIDEMRYFNLDLQNLDGPSLKAWFRERHCAAGLWLRSGFQTLAKNPSKWSMACTFILSRYFYQWLWMAKRWGIPPRFSFAVDSEQMIDLLRAPQSAP